MSSGLVVKNTPENKKKTMYSYLDPLNHTTKKAFGYKLKDHLEIKIPRGVSDPNELIPLFNKTFKTIDFKDSITLRKNQEASFNNLLKEVTNCVYFDGIFCRDTAFGKTIVSLKLVSTLKRKTLVIVNRLDLKLQWEDKIKKYLDCKIGSIQGSNNIDGDIVLATVQTLIKGKHNLDSFYLVLLDEVHLFSSEIFSSILYLLKCNVRIGLTATLKRKDNKQNLLYLHLNNILEDTQTNLKQKTIVSIIPTNIFIETEYIGFKKINFSKMLTTLACDSNRNTIILNQIKELIFLKKDLKCIVMSDRKEQLIYLHKNISDSQLFTGTSVKPDFSKPILFATFQIAGTGFDCPELNTLIFASPRSDIQQIIGRIYRKKHTINPRIIDFFDPHFIFKNQLYKRIKQYKQFIEYPEISNFLEKEKDTILFLEE